MLSNVRGEPSFGAGVPHAQVQTPRPDAKLPPVGNFPPPSATKENKKRRGGPGSQMIGGSGAVDSGVGPGAQNNRNGGARGNANKVSHCCCGKHQPQKSPSTQHIPLCDLEIFEYPTTHQRLCPVPIAFKLHCYQKRIPNEPSFLFTFAELY